MNQASQLTLILAASLLMCACSTTQRHVPARRIVEVNIVGDETRISGRSEPGKTYKLQKTENLVSGKWQDVGNTVTASADRISFTDPVSSNRACFYRIIVAE